MGEHDRRVPGVERDAVQTAKRAWRRWMYRSGRQHRLAALLNRVTANVVAVGLAPRRLASLEVRGRRSGRLRSFPVVVTDYEDRRYLVAMLGESTNWVRNVRAADGRATIRHRRREAVRLVEVEPGDRAGVLRRYLQLAPGARAHFPVDPRASLDEFEAIALQCPVFEVRAEAPDARR